MPTRRVHALSLLLTLFACGGLFLGPAAGQEPSKATDKSEKRVFPLKNIKAQDVVRILRDVYRDTAGLAVSVDDASNSLVVSGKAEVLAEVAQLLEKLDVAGQSGEPPRPEFRVIALANLTPDRSTDEALRLVLDGRRGRFVLDRDRKLVILYAEPAPIAEAQKLLHELDQMAGFHADRGIAECTVRLVWLATGPGGENAPALPDDLKEVAAALRKLGIDKPHLAGQALIRTQFNARFEQTGQAKFGEASGLLTATGQASLARTAIRLEIAVRATQRGRDTSPLCNLQTETLVPPNEPVLLGVTPLQEQTVAFVVQVLPALPVKRPPEKPAKPAPPPKGDEKPLSFEFRNRPWHQVFEWLSDQTGLPVAPAEFKLTGAFTFIPPKGKQYTLPEVIDILNEALSQQHFILVRRERSFALLPADRIDPALIPRVRVEDLGRRGSTELVCVVVPLQALRVEEIAPEIKKLLGPFGEVVVVSQGNRLVLQDTAGNLRRIVQLIQEIEAGKPPKKNAARDEKADPALMPRVGTEKPASPV